ncbi:hypothetical protein HYV81_02200 [Candidatus Woesearchaeota archaeon]|nr:hypothetical protein [Candidatus Woesearchaeota archaeon]
MAKIAKNNISKKYEGMPTGIILLIVFFSIGLFLTLKNLIYPYFQIGPYLTKTWAAVPFIVAIGIAQIFIIYALIKRKNWGWRFILWYNASLILLELINSVFIYINPDLLVSQFLKLSEVDSLFYIQYLSLVKHIAIFLFVTEAFIRGLIIAYIYKKKYYFTK